MRNDSVGLNCFSAERAATGDCAQHAVEQSANSGVESPEAEWRTFSEPSAAMAQKVTAIEKSASGFKLLADGLVR